MNFNSSFLIRQSELILNCYEKALGTCLRSELNIPLELQGSALAEALFNAPIAILSHDIVYRNGIRDNIYNYGNQTALDLFERTFEEQTQLASTRSTGEHFNEQANRNNLLAQTLAKGSIKFSSKRLSSSNKEVILQNAILFNLFDTQGVYSGQAVVFYPQASA